MVTAREHVACAWHVGSDHADHSPFGGPLCNCDRVAERMLPMLRDMWRIGYASGNRSGPLGTAIPCERAGPHGERNHPNHVRPLKDNTELIDRGTNWANHQEAS